MLSFTRAEAVDALRNSLVAALAAQNVAISAALTSLAAQGVASNEVVASAANIAAALEPAALAVNVSNPTLSVALLAAGVTADEVQTQLDNAQALSQQAATFAATAESVVADADSISVPDAVVAESLDSLLSSYLAVRGLEDFQPLRDQVADTAVNAAVVGAAVGFSGLLLVMVLMMRAYKVCVWRGVVCCVLCVLLTARSVY